MKLYTTVVLDNEKVKCIEAKGDLLQFLQRYFAGKIAESITNRLKVYRRKDKTGYLPSNTTRFDCVVDIEAVGMETHGIFYDMIPVEEVK
jgi:hypothetical protein